MLLKLFRKLRCRWVFTTVALYIVGARVVLQAVAAAPAVALKCCKAIGN